MKVLTAKKLAEVEAFLRVSGDIVSRSKTQTEMVRPHILSELDSLSSGSIEEYVPAEVREVFEAKVTRTIDKLTAMMELYIGDEWGNPTEVLEWCSFFSGAAAAHCAVAGGLAGKEGLDDIAADLQPLQDKYRALLDGVISELAD